MRSRERFAWVIVSAALAIAVLAERTDRPPPPPEVVRPRPTPGARLSMAALHQQGGVPLGWQLALPPGNPTAGREAFDQLGCAACHRVAGERFRSEVSDPVGPELTGMGSHHPPAYFAESVLNPDAVLLDGPGYIGADGLSTMPVYPDMTIGQLSDLVAYLASLRDDGSPSGHAASASLGGSGLDVVALNLRDRPKPPSAEAHAFFAQGYEVLPGRLEAFEKWFATEGRKGFLDADGIVTLETFADAGKPTNALTTVFGFRDEAALRTFLGDPAMAELWKQFDAFVGPHGHVVADRPLVYRVQSLSGE